MRKKINENSIINEVQLEDIYSTAAKLEQQTISLSEMAMKFSDQRVKKGALRIKEMASQYTNLLSELLTNAEGAEDVGEEMEESEIGLLEGLSRLELFEAIDDIEDIDIDDIDADDIEMDDIDIDADVKELNLSTFFDKVIDELDETVVDELKLELEKVLSVLESEELKSKIKDIKNIDDLNEFLDDIYDFALDNDYEVIF